MTGMVRRPAVRIRGAEGEACLTSAGAYRGSTCVVICVRQVLFLYSDEDEECNVILLQWGFQGESVLVMALVMVAWMAGVMLMGRGWDGQGSG